MGLVIRNNWENLEYYFNGSRIHDITSVKINGKWFDTVSKTSRVSYSDHGHTYYASQKTYTIKVETELGIKLPIELSGIVNMVEELK